MYHSRLPDLSPSWSHWHCTFTNYRKLSTTFSLLYHWNCTSVPVGEWQPILFRYCSKLMMSQGWRTTSWIVSQQSKIELVDLPPHQPQNHSTPSQRIEPNTIMLPMYHCCRALSNTKQFYVLIINISQLYTAAARKYIKIIIYRWVYHKQPQTFQFSRGKELICN